MAVTSAILAAEVAPPSRRSRWRILRRWIRRDPLGVTSMIFVAVIGLLALVAPVLPLGDPNATSLDALKSPSTHHWFGTDNLGRDVFSRAVWGGRVSLYIAIVVSIFAGLISSTLGLISGYVGGWVDFVIQRVVDVVMAIPWIVLVFGLVIILGSGGISNVALLLSLLYGIRNSRVIRSVCQIIRSTTYVEASRATGASPFRIVWRQVLPNTFGPLIVLTSTVWGVAIIAEATLSFLGLGAPPTTPSWGQMISSARPWMEKQPLYVIGPGIFIGATVWSLNMIGDFLRDIIDPRLRGE